MNHERGQNISPRPYLPYAKHAPNVSQTAICQLNWLFGKKCVFWAIKKMQIALVVWRKFVVGRVGGGGEVIHVAQINKLATRCEPTYQFVYQTCQIRDSRDSWRRIFWFAVEFWRSRSRIWSSWCEFVRFCHTIQPSGPLSTISLPDYGAKWTPLAYTSSSITIYGEKFKWAFSISTPQTIANLKLFEYWV